MPALATTFAVIAQVDGNLDAREVRALVASLRDDRDGRVRDAARKLSRRFG
jgi:hypothetical protein